MPYEGLHESIHISPVFEQSRLPVKQLTQLAEMSLVSSPFVGLKEQINDLNFMVILMT